MYTQIATASHMQMRPNTSQTDIFYSLTTGNLTASTGSATPINWQLYALTAPTT